MQKGHIFQYKFAHPRYNLSKSKMGLKKESNRLCRDLMKEAREYCPEEHHLELHKILKRDDPIRTFWYRDERNAINQNRRLPVIP